MAREEETGPAQHAPGPNALPPAPARWDRSQQAVIEATPEDRFLVSAGRGAGMTALACARVAHLIASERFEPSSIWMITPATVTVPEVVRRIAMHLGGVPDASGVTVATLDRNGWRIHSGFDAEGPIPSTESDIGFFRDILRLDETIAEYLSLVDHLLVDQSQELEGDSADFVIEVIDRLHPLCGVTAFTSDSEAVGSPAGEMGPPQEKAPVKPLSGRLRDGEAGVLKHLGSTEVRFVGLNLPVTANVEIPLQTRPVEESAPTIAEGRTARSPLRSPGTVRPEDADWDPSQRAVIEAPHNHRLLVSAGPGTGKTAVACARVAHLIDAEDRAPNSIWMISFTRTAVREIRERIRGYLKNAGDANAVKLATLDSHAWAIQSGFNEEARILGTYNENIQRMCDRVRDDKDVAEYLASVEHVVVDEAQDLVGLRSDLVIEIFHRLRESCGATVFADEAQAIYGFADDQEVKQGSVKEPPLPPRIRRAKALAFRELELTTVHRTNSPGLLRIFRDTRRKVLAAEIGTKCGLDEIRREVRQLADGTATNDDNDGLAGLEDTLILYRRRCDVLLRASFLAAGDTPYRIRMSGLPVCLAPWIGATLSGYLDLELRLDKFRRLWSARVLGSPLASCEPEQAWHRLFRIAGSRKNVVNMRRLRQVLGRKQPPAELCLPEFGDRGPVIGTIHTSKGREADTIHLMLPPGLKEDADHAEESRVVFVGATRARSRLLVGRGYGQQLGVTETSRRTFSLKTRGGEPKAQVEIGRDGDIDAVGLAGRQYFGSRDEVSAAQNRIRAFVGDRARLVGNRMERVHKYAYRLTEENEPDRCIAVLSTRRVNRDLFEVADAVQEWVSGERRLPKVIRHLFALGARTVVLPPDATELEDLHEPWRSNGILLSPMLVGYTTLWFPKSAGRRRSYA